MAITAAGGLRLPSSQRTAAATVTIIAATTTEETLAASTTNRATTARAAGVTWQVLLVEAAQEVTTTAEGRHATAIEALALMAAISPVIVLEPASWRTRTGLETSDARSDPLINTNLTKTRLQLKNCYTLSKEGQVFLMKYNWSNSLKELEAWMQKNMYPKDSLCSVVIFESTQIQVVLRPPARSIRSQS